MKIFLPPNVQHGVDSSLDATSAWEAGYGAVITNVNLILTHPLPSGTQAPPQVAKSLVLPRWLLYWLPEASRSEWVGVAFWSPAPVIYYSLIYSGAQHLTNSELGTDHSISPLQSLQRASVFPPCLSFPPPSIFVLLYPASSPIPDPLFPQRTTSQSSYFISDFSSSSRPSSSAQHWGHDCEQHC